MKQLSLSIILSIMIVLNLFGQSFIPIGFDIPGAVGVEVAPDESIWVVAGGGGANDGQILRFNSEGISETIIHQLPSFFDAELQELKSALNLYFIDDMQFYVVVGGGPGSDFGVLALYNIEDYDPSEGPLSLTDAREIIHISEWVLGQGYVESNPYSMLIDANGDFLITDAAANAIVKYQTATASFSILTDLPSTPNPLPFGPPAIEPVPTQILHHPNGGYLVSCLTGFPFVNGESNIYHISETGEVSIHTSGHTLITDMAYDPLDGGLLTLQFANFGEMGFEFGSAQLIKLSEDGSREVIEAGFGPSAGLGVAKNGSIYASHLFLGQLLELERCISDAGTLRIPSGRDHLEVCVSDGFRDPVSFSAKNTIGPNSLVITDEQGNILSVTNDKKIDFDNAGEGTCKVYNIASGSGASEIELGASIHDLEGCISISNAITVERIICIGCHAPLNLKFQQRNNGSATIYWDKVRDAQGYELHISYMENPSNSFTIPVRGRKVRLRYPSSRKVIIKVRAICGYSEMSDYSASIEIKSEVKNIAISEKRSSLKIDDDEELIDLMKSPEFNIYPNPATDEFILSTDINGGEEGSIEIMDLNGRLVYYQELNTAMSKQKIDVSKIYVGIFIVAIKVNGQYPVTQKLVITR